MKKQYDAKYDIVRFQPGDVMWAKTPFAKRNSHQMWEVKCIIHAEKPSSGGYWVRWIDQGWGDHTQGKNDPNTISTKLWYPDQLYPK